MPDGLSTRQINAIRNLLGKHDISAAELAKVDYHDLRHLPGIGNKSIDGILVWLSQQGYEMQNMPRDHGGRFPRGQLQLHIRLSKAAELLEQHGYTVLPPPA